MESGRFIDLMTAIYIRCISVEMITPCDCGCFGFYRFRTSLLSVCLTWTGTSSCSTWREPSPAFQCWNGPASSPPYVDQVPVLLRASQAVCYRVVFRRSDLEAGMDSGAPVMCGCELPV